MFRRILLSLASVLAGLGFAASMAHAQGPETVVYDNLSTLSSLGPNYLFDERNNFSTLVGSNTVTALVGDDLIFRQQLPSNHPPIIPAPMRLTKIAFYVTNRNTTAVTIRPLLRIWDDNAGQLGGGTDEPGTLLRKLNMGPITLAAAPSPGTFSSTLVTVDLTGGTNPFGGLNIPIGTAGDPYRIWAGLAFDDNGGRTGATLNQINNVGQLVNNISNTDNVTLVGRSGDVAWGTNNNPGSQYFGEPGPDLWARNLPPGAFFNYFRDPNHPGADGIPGTDDDPFANFAWQVWARPGFVMPEPGTAGLMAPVGLTAGILLWRRRSRRSR